MAKRGMNSCFISDLRSLDFLRAGITQFFSQRKSHLLYFGVLWCMGIVGFIVSPYHSRTRLVYFFLGLATYSVTVAFIDSPRRFWRAFCLLALVGLLVTVIGAAGTTTWTTYKL